MPDHILVSKLIIDYSYMNYKRDLMMKTSDNLTVSELSLNIVHARLSK